MKRNLQPQQRIWVGALRNTQGSADAETAASLVCCGSCAPEYIECVNPVLQVLLDVVGRTACSERDDRFLCATCGLRLLMLAERVRFSARYAWDIKSEWAVGLEALFTQTLLAAAEMGHLLAKVNEKWSEAGWLESVLDEKLTAAGPVDYDTRIR